MDKLFHPQAVGHLSSHIQQKNEFIKYYLYYQYASHLYSRMPETVEIDEAI